jgi:uncharacterized protein
MDVTTLIAVAVVGLGVGFLGGLFGKGGSAVATPLLAAVGIPAIAAVASPLPAVIPATIVSARAYARSGHVDRSLLVPGALIGLPATLLGALTTRWVGGSTLVVATEVVLLALGVRFVLHPDEPHEAPRPVGHRVARVAVVAAAVGFLAGLLANAGGFLFAPLFVVVLRTSLKDAFGTSAALASVLAVPGTIAHAAMGHIDWAVTFVFALTSVPLAGVGARVAMRMRVQSLSRFYGAGLIALSATLLAVTAR